MNTENGYYIHQTPGRLRVRIPGIKGVEAAGEAITKILRDLEGVRLASVNTITGSVIIQHDPDSSSGDDILERLAEHGLIDADRMFTNDQMFSKAATRAGERLSKVAISWAMGKALEGSPLSILAAFI